MGIKKTQDLFDKPCVFIFFIKKEELFFKF
jgi:hypothetical protein